MSENHRGPEVPEAEVRVVECHDGLARITSKELAITHFVKSGTLQNACSTRPRVVVGLGRSAHSHTFRLMNSRRKGPKRIMTKVLWLCWKREIGKKENLSSMNVTIERGNLWKDVIRNWNKIHLNVSFLMHDNWVADFRTRRRRSLFSGRALTCRSRSSVWSSQRLLHVTPKFETKIPRSVAFICPGEPHERSPNAPKFEDRSQEETEWQEQGAREAAWKLAKSVFKLKVHERATFFSPLENRCLLASTLQLEEREFVVDSGASMHMISKKDLSDAEMDTLTKSCSPSIVITANGEVQKHEEATVYVQELDVFLTMKVLENTPAVLSLGQLFDENGYSFEWINGQKPHLIRDGIRIACNTENFVPIVVPGLTSSSSTSSSTSRTPVKQESHSSSSSSSSPSSPTVGEVSVREREDAPNSDISPVPVSELVDDRTGEPVETRANEIPKNKLKKRPRSNGETCVTILRFWNGGKNSGKIWWIMKFHCRETLTPVLLMKPLSSPHSRDVRIWESTICMLMFPKTEIARSVNGPKLQGPHAEDAMAKPYLEL